MTLSVGSESHSELRRVRRSLLIVCSMFVMEEAKKLQRMQQSSLRVKEPSIRQKFWPWRTPGWTEHVFRLALASCQKSRDGMAHKWPDFTGAPC